MKKTMLSMAATTALVGSFVCIEYNHKENSTHLQKPIELNFKQGEKVLVSPIGEVVGFDGRVFKIDGESVVANTKENAVDLPFEINHGFDVLYGGKAAGWIAFDSLEVREDGIYGSLELNELGKELVEGMYYRYVSPAYIMDRQKEDRTVLSLDSVGLVNTPNLVNKALNSKEDDSVLKELNSKVETLEKENNDASATIEKTGKELEEANSKLEASQEDLKQSNSKVKDLTIALAVEQNKILPKDVEFCKKLDETQLEEYLQNNSGGTLAQELGSQLNPKENNNTKSIVETAVNAGSQK